MGPDGQVNSRGFRRGGNGGGGRGRGGSGQGQSQVNGYNNRGRGRWMGGGGGGGGFDEYRSGGGRPMDRERDNGTENELSCSEAQSPNSALRLPILKYVMLFRQETTGLVDVHQPLDFPAVVVVETELEMEILGTNTRLVILQDLLLEEEVNEETQDPTEAHHPLGSMPTETLKTTHNPILLHN